MARVRIALVGCGAVSDFVADLAYPKLTEHCEVVAAVDQRIERAEALAARLGAKPFASLSEALATEVDAVDIRVQHMAHKAVALEAAAAGKHVLIEKPIATTLEDALEIAEAVERAGVVGSVAENYTFFEPVRVAARLLRDGEIGDLLVARTHRVAHVSGVWARDGWREDASQAGGVLLDQGCHFTNLLRRTVGEISHVHALDSSRAPGWSAEDSAVVNLRFADGGIGQQFYCWATPTPEIGAEAQFFGTRGSLEIWTTYGTPGGGVVVYTPQEPDGRWVLRGGDYMESFAPTLEDWVRAILDERQPGMTLHDGVEDLRVVSAMYRSIESGAEAAVAEPDPRRDHRR